ncbi:putative ubiquitin carboxyl-terminal hydrolase FAF-Y [Portunus trituberculatus]|uniref:Putative ubiquitin carboxyl-terminal hydrolase FAF-Y n=1 Tax=Portunus trituberculatus TaxID=210409 RepID=A0A5B7ED98_PORTR|nr:putative ubiquitin carboxyl-terminal hydrolase FAF-Y [Portunus trituberculatus]
MMLAYNNSSSSSLMTASLLSGDGCWVGRSGDVGAERTFAVTPFAGLVQAAFLATRGGLFEPRGEATYTTNTAPVPNPHGDPSCPEPLMTIEPKVADILYGRPTYVKKIIEDANTSEDTVKLLKFCCWENPLFSSAVLSELLWQIAYSYTYELRPYLDLLLHMLLLEDSWQNHRIHNALKGIPDDREGLFDTIQRSKNHYQKRAYQCIKCMVALFSSCLAAQQMLNSNGDLKDHTVLVNQSQESSCKLGQCMNPPIASYQQPITLVYDLKTKVVFVGA